MSKISGAIREINRMDDLAARDTWLNQIHPLAKLLVTLFYIAVTVSFSRYHPVGIFVMVIYPAALFILGDLSLMDALSRLRIVLPLVCMVGLFNPFFDRQPAITLGGFLITQGMISMITLMMKGILAVLASYLLIASTGIEKLCYALRLLHVPAILVTQILLTYRYISLLLTEASRIVQAYSLRAPRQRGIHFKVWGSLAGQLLLRSMDRAGEVYESMSLRGFSGEFFYSRKSAFQWKDGCFLILWCLLFAAVRLFWR